MIRRPSCPICQVSEGYKTFQIGYDSPEVKEYLDYFYGERQGVNNKVDMSVLEGENLVIRYCADCEFYWHEYILDDDGMNSLYEQWIDPNYSRQKRNDWDLRISKILKATHIEDYFNDETPPENLKVLDFGMGWGTYLLAVRSLGCEVHGVEISDLRRNNVNSNDITVHKYLEEVNGKFDVITSHQTFEHLPNPRETLTSLRELLQPNGLLHMTTPNIKQKPSKETVLEKGPFQPLEHINGFTHASTLALAAECDLAPVSVSSPCILNPKRSKRKAIKSLMMLTNTYRIYAYLKRRMNPEPEFFRPT